MKPLFDLATLDTLKSSDKVPLQCEFCNNTFYRQVCFVKSDLKLCKYKHNYCGNICANLVKITSVTKPCQTCLRSVTRELRQFKKSKFGYVFCSCSCAAIFNNAHKTHGTRRSKLEIWVETKLMERYPSIDFKFNQKTDINSELDIYIPALKLAFEINGIFHYKPIYGLKKFQQTKANDELKTTACSNAGIQLVIIDISHIIQFNEKDGLICLKQIADKITSELYLHRRY